MSVRTLNTTHSPFVQGQLNVFTLVWVVYSQDGPTSTFREGQLKGFNPHHHSYSGCRCGPTGSSHGSESCSSNTVSSRLVRSDQTDTAYASLGFRQRWGLYFSQRILCGPSRLVCHPEWPPDIQNYFKSTASGVRNGGCWTCSICIFSCKTMISILAELTRQSFPPALGIHKQK